jgi:hypothetical protein
MPKYQMYFDTLGGETRHYVDIDEEETLDGVLNEILQELRERQPKRVLKGDGKPQVRWSGHLLDLNTPLPGQGIRPNEVLYVSTRARNG